MRKLGLLILCGACWLAGYYCGRQPGSPDIFGWISMQVRKLRVCEGRDIADVPDVARPEGRRPPAGTALRD